MNLLAAAFVALCSSCLFAPAAARAELAPAQSPSRFFPAPKSGISIQLGAEKPQRLCDLLGEFSRATGMTLVSDEATRRMLEVNCGLNQAAEVPAAQVYAFVESVLSYHGFVLYHLRTDEPRLLGIAHPRAQGDGSASIKPVYVPVEELGAWKDHPAFLVQTMLTLPNVDVRMLSNSMRVQFGDNRMQVVIPLGNSNSMLITAPAGAAASLISMLQRCDAEAERDATKAAPKPAQEIPPKPAR